MYEVVVLAERALADVDARVLADLYRGTPEPTHVHLLLPVDGEAAAELASSVNLLRTHGLDADGETVPHEPIDTLESVVVARGSNEVVIMTRSHVVADTLHTDWASRARRELEVPVLHLLEQADH